MRMNLTPAVKNIIIINVLVYLACFVFPQLDVMLTGYYFESENFECWQIVSHMFMHSKEDYTHIFFNMYGLYLFGTALENYWGTKRFLIYYMVCGVGAFFLHMGVNFLQVQQLAGQLTFNQYKEVVEHGASIIGTNEYYLSEAMNKFNSAINSGVVGASGAVFGVLLGFGMLFPNTELMLLFPPIPIKAKYFVLIYGAIEFYMAMRHSNDDNVAHYAHLGGMLFGFLLLKYWQKKGRVW